MPPDLPAPKPRLLEWHRESLPVTRSELRPSNQIIPKRTSQYEGGLLSPCLHTSKSILLFSLAPLPPGVEFHKTPAVPESSLCPSAWWAWLHLQGSSGGGWGQRGWGKVRKRGQGQVRWLRGCLHSPAVEGGGRLSGSLRLSKITNQTCQNL